MGNCGNISFQIFHLQHLHSCLSLVPRPKSNCLRQRGVLSLITSPLLLQIFLDSDDWSACSDSFTFSTNAWTSGPVPSICVQATRLNISLWTILSSSNSFVCITEQSEEDLETFHRTLLIVQTNRSLKEVCYLDLFIRASFPSPPARIGRRPAQINWLQPPTVPAKGNKPKLLAVRSVQ